jgi:hypothetical protein
MMPRTFVILHTKLTVTVYLRSFNFVITLIREEYYVQGNWKWLSLNNTE